MKPMVKLWGAAALLSVLLAGCGGGGDSAPAVSQPPVDPPGPSVNVSAAVAAAAAVPSNDSATNPTAPFTVLQMAGLPAVTADGTVKVNFTVFSNGAVKTGLTLADMSFAIARLIPGSNGNADEWVSYVSRKAVATAGPGAAQSPPAVAMQATTDPKTSDSQLVYNAQGYYTYTFTAKVTDPGWTATIGGVEYSTNGVAFVPAATHRVAIQLAYKDAAGATVRVNPYFDFTFAGSGRYASVPLSNPTTQDSVISDVASCNTCHQALALHGGGRVAAQYCVMCHNPGTTDPDSGNVLTFSTMTHKIHAGRLLASVPGGEDYMIWGFRGTKYDYSEVGYPQDLRNCANCHSGDNPATPQGNNWQTVSTQGACVTCHAGGQASAWYISHTPFAQALIGPGATAPDLTNAQCAGCHAPGTSLSAAVVHWPQIQVNQVLYKMNIETAVFNDTADHKGRTVTVKYTLTNPTDGNKPYRLSVSAAECTADSSGALSNCGNAKFGNLRAYLGYQNIPGQPASVTEFSAYNNGGSGAYACLYEGPVTASCPRTATHNGSNVYTVTIPLPDDTATQIAFGTAMVMTVGQIKEAKQQTMTTVVPRPPVLPTVLVNTAVQHTSTQLALSGALQPRRTIVSDEKCNVCHAVLGTASGSNTLPNAFHSGARNTWQSCIVCHDPNRSSSTLMTNGATLPDGSPMREQFQSKYMMHGIHGNSKRTFPYTHGNAVFGKFCNPANPAASAAAGCDPSLVLASNVTDYATEALWPGPTVDGQKQVSCNACHVNNSYEFNQGTLGAVVSTRPTGSSPLDWNVITPQAASCVSCHNSDAAVNHVLSAGNSRYGNATQAMSLQITETCADCHSPTGFLSVRAAHKQ